MFHACVKVFPFRVSTSSFVSASSSLWALSTRSWTENDIIALDVAQRVVAMCMCVRVCARVCVDCVQTAMAFNELSL